jgi:carbon-monoxide dehydrogenase large subunit
MGLIGQKIRRTEDPALLLGTSAYTGDLPVQALEAAFVRSSVAHARITGIDVDDARAMPGVAGVYVAADFGPLPAFAIIPVPEVAQRKPIASDVVRFVGEIVAVVVADTLAQAVDAAEQVVVDYEPLDVVVDVEDAVAEGAPVLFPEIGSNAVIRMGSPEPDDLTVGADIVLDVWFDNQRIAVAPLETNNILVEPHGDGLVVHASTQSPHTLRNGLAGLLGLTPDQVHLIAPAVGGGFGAKSTPDPEYVLSARVARRLDRPVRWRQTRTENLLTMHGRSQRQHVRLAAKTDGTLVAIRADLLADGGAYPSINAYLADLTGRMLAGVYAVPQASSGSQAVATNTAPPTAFRGAGRPEAASLVERVMDILAAELGLDPVEVRRKNFIQPDQFPYTSPAGVVYDCGDYEAALARALEVADYSALRREQQERRARGDRWLLGIGVCVYVEITAGFGPSEFADVEVAADGSATVRVGTFSHGQGHKTTFAQIASDALNIPFDRITVLNGDTDKVKRGSGTSSSRSVQVGGTAVHVASTQLVERARQLAADLLEAAVSDIVQDDSGFAVAGVPARRIGWAEVVAAADAHSVSLERDEVAPEARRGGLFVELDWERSMPSFPFGAHVAVVEVDRETGEVRLVQHIAIDDCGTIINPLLADGQVHGGVASGAAQALLEAVVYDPDGNVLTSNLADYGFISTAELPSFTVDHTVTPTPINPLGAKGIGESGTIGATPAVQNAVVDALAHLGVRHIDMPCTAERVWRAANGLGDDGRLAVWRRGA